MNTSNDRLPNEVYFDFFQKDALGKRMFEELCLYHWDIDVFDENAIKMAHNEGRRTVIRWLMTKIAAGAAQQQEEVPSNG